MNIEDTFSSERFGLAEALRFTFPGVLILTYFYIFDANIVRAFVSDAGPVIAPLIVTVVGTLVYFVYRPLFYDYFIESVLTLFQKKNENYRRFLMEEYSLKIVDASTLWIEIRDTCLRNRPHMRTQAAGIHMTYLASILALPFAAVSFSSEKQPEAYVFLFILVVTVIAAVIFDTFYEKTECKMLMGIPKRKRNTVAKALGYRDPGAQCDKKRRTRNLLLIICVAFLGLSVFWLGATLILTFFVSLFASCSLIVCQL